MIQITCDAQSQTDMLPTPLKMVTFNVICSAACGLMLFLQHLD